MRTIKDSKKSMRLSYCLANLYESRGQKASLMRRIARENFDVIHDLVYSVLISFDE